MPKVSQKIIAILQRGGVGILPTDTIYGLVGSALNQKTVSRIYKLKQRAKNKKFIILIGEISDLAKFGIKINKKLENKLAKYWPGPNSLIINKIAFRLPRPIWLRTLLKQTGPLIAPSANPGGLSPAQNITEARKYFGQKVDFYLPGKTHKKPSKLINLLDGEALRS